MREISSADALDACISFSSSDTNRLCGPSPSLTTVPGSAAESTNVPPGMVIGASPIETLRNRRSNGLRREASRIASFTLAPLAFMSARMVSMATPSRRTSGSVQIWALTGSR